MKKYFATAIGRLRLVAFIEGLSLLVLVVIAVPLKYFWDDPSWVKSIGPIHGALFILFILNTLSVSVQYKWNFRKTTWKVLASCFIPFANFYVDYKILAPLQIREK